MNITTRVPSDRTITAIGYKYNSMKFLGFITTKGLEVMIQVITIYLIYLKIILIFLFNLFSVLTKLAGISMPVMN